MEAADSFASQGTTKRFNQHVFDRFNMSDRPSPQATQDAATKLANQAGGHPPTIADRTTSVRGYVPILLRNQSLRHLYCALFSTENEI